MTLNGWFQIAFMLALVIATARPLGLYTASVLQGGPTFLDPALRPLEHRLYALAGVDARREQSWRAYTVALLMFSAAGFVLLYAILRLQHLLPLNPQGFGPMSEHLAFNTAASFVTNTNWQSYGGETTLSYLSQMVGLTVQNFLSAATGFAIAAALARAFARSGSGTVGNFWVDLTRTTLYVLLPLSLVVALRFGRARHAAERSGPTSTRRRWKAPSRRSRRGRWRARSPSSSSAPTAAASSTSTAPTLTRTPTIWTNLIQTWAIFSLALGLAIAFGRMIGREREGWALLGVMVLFLAVGCRGGLLGRGLRQSADARLVSPAATWRARRCASARRCPPSGPCSPPAPPTARSTRCTTPSCRSAASSRSRSSRSAR